MGRASSQKGKSTRALPRSQSHAALAKRTHNRFHIECLTGNELSTIKMGLSGRWNASSNEKHSQLPPTLCPITQQLANWHLGQTSYADGSNRCAKQSSKECSRPFRLATARATRGLGATGFTATGSAKKDTGARSSNKSASKTNCRLACQAARPCGPARASRTWAGRPVHPCARRHQCGFILNFRSRVVSGQPECMRSASTPECEPATMSRTPLATCLHSTNLLQVRHRRHLPLRYPAHSPSAWQGVLQRQPGAWQHECTKGAHDRLHIETLAGNELSKIKVGLSGRWIASSNETKQNQLPPTTHPVPHHTATGQLSFGTNELRLIYLSSNG